MKKNQPPKATGFSEPYGACSDVEVMGRFELPNDGFADRCLTTWLHHHMLYLGRNNVLINTNML